ncbi:MAG: hypothetical protein NC078_10945 [Ruminococcus sp.]|nr:hypothetical protein [Ruminococcus sp.]
MNDLKIFSNSEFGELGVMLIDGHEYFPATQCAKVLGYKDPCKAIKQHCKSEGWVIRPGVSYTTNQHGVTTQQVTEIKYINEGNLYRLIVSSKLPAAEKFERWVFDEVLPSIRKNGGYGGVDIERVITAMATAVALEIMKQVMPAVMGAGSVPQVPTVWEEPLPKERKRKKPTGIIWKLAPEIRRTVDEMLRANMSYKDVQTFLSLNGIGISQAAICNYYNTAIREETE